ncbi:hypothetical protein NW762_012553 [Fusarium torreyae]|uniref:Uncharacterized protein n=1 Tax=Fusarium torreyae TaxID=1237075 RepID=A0A9W8VB61_9HYPO|nr:hypothetical protein NW762_012553 [Fusarium torreyae]
MSINCGFDIFPPLVPTKQNKEAYCGFVGEVIDFFQGPSNKTFILILGSDPNLPRMLDEGFVHFLLPAMPKIPIDAENCDCFLSFSSNVSASPVAQRHVQEVFGIARRYFGGRVHRWVNQSDIYRRGELREAENKVIVRKRINATASEEESEFRVTHSESAGKDGQRDDLTTRVFMKDERQLGRGTRW